MEIDYEISRLCLSLQELSAVKVVEQLLHANDIASVRTVKSRVIPLKQANAAVRTLDVPYPVKQLIRSLLLPVSEELTYWYQGLHLPGKAILTQQGTLDIISSAKYILDDVKVDRCTRFLLACAVCSEKHIYELGKQLSPCERDKIHTQETEKLGRFDKLWRFRKVASCWLTAYKDRVGEQFDGKDLSPMTYDNMLQIALKNGDDTNMRFFLKKAKNSDILREHKKQLSRSRCSRLELNYSPATLCYMISIVKQNERSTAIVEFSGLLLSLLTNWPYQRFFLKASFALIGGLPRVHFWRVLYFVVQKRIHGFWDWNYREMFIMLFRLGAVQRRNSSLSSDTECVKLAIMVFKDDYIVRFFLSQISADDKKKFLLGFETNTICVRCLIRRKYKRLEMFVRSCAMRRKDLLVKFKKESIALYQKCPERVPFFMLNHKLSDKQWASGLRKLGRIVDKIIAEECSEDAGK